LGREKYENTNGIYLNNAATGYPKPTEVVTAVNSYLHSVPPNPTPGGLMLRSDDPIMICREKLADFFNIANPDNIIFTSGATESINLVVRGLDQDKGHIITTITEHNSVLRPLKRLERRGKLLLSIVDCDPDGRVSPEKIESQIQPNTRAIIINHCSHVTGQVQNIRALAEIAGKNDIWLIVDAAQSAGLLPIDVADMGIDILIFSGHKYLYGLPGTGGLYISENIYLRPLKTGGTGIRGESLYQPNGRPALYESGTHNYPGIISLSAGLDFIFKEGIDNIHKTITGHISRIRKAIDGMPKLKIHGNPASNSSILSLSVKRLTPSNIGHILENSYGIISGNGLHCAPLIHRALGSYPEGTVRISPSCFTTEHEIDQLINALEKICHAKKVPEYALI
jgi:cysteine desulfurase/selenocysteine lyase